MTYEIKAVRRPNCRCVVCNHCRRWHRPRCTVKGCTCEMFL